MLIDYLLILLSTLTVGTLTDVVALEKFWFGMKISFINVQNSKYVCVCVTENLTLVS